MSHWVYITVVILGLGCITVLTRSSFFLLPKSWVLPPALAQALQYAPIAALAAIIAPEVFGGAGGGAQANAFWASPKFIGAMVAFITFQLSKNMGLTIVLGMAAFTVARLV